MERHLRLLELGIYCIATQEKFDQIMFSMAFSENKCITSARHTLGNSSSL